MTEIEETSEIEGLTEWDTTDGIHVLRVHYTADPTKRDPVWIESAKIGATKNDWDQEMEIDFSVTKGLPWYPEFKFSMHVHCEPLRPLANRPIIAGFDYGLTPATVFLQVLPSGQMVVLHPEIQSWESGIVAHAHKVRAEIATNFPNAQFYFYGDPAGNQRAQTDERTCVQVLREDFGILVRNGPVSFSQRDIPIRKALTTLVGGGRPQLIIDPRNELLIEALKGGYRRMESNGEILDRLEDNKYTHIVDALGYAISMVIYSHDEDLDIKMPKLGRL